MDSQMPQSRWRNRKYPWDYYKILAKISGEETFGAPDPTCAILRYGEETIGEWPSLANRLDRRSY